MHRICHFRDIDYLQRKRESRYTSKRVQPCSLLSLSGNLCYVPGESIVKAGRSAAEYKKVLTLGNGDVTIGLKVSSFRNALADGKVNTSVDTKNQPKHIQGKAWKNQVKQAVQSGEKTTPRSLLAKGLDPQDLINKYAGTGDYYEFRGNNKYPDKFITLPFEVGRTYNKKTGKYEATNRVQIKYDENKGAHIFPVLMR